MQAEELRQVHCAEVGEHGECAAEVLVAAVVIDRHHGRNAGAERGSQSLPAVLQSQAGRCGQAELREGVSVDIGGGLLFGDAVAGGDDLEPRCGSGRQAGFEQGGDIFPRGGGGDGQAQAGS